jgi:hypothetical protein
MINVVRRRPANTDTYLHTIRHRSASPEDLSVPRYAARGYKKAVRRSSAAREAIGPAARLPGRQLIGSQQSISTLEVRFDANCRAVPLVHIWLSQQTSEASNHTRRQT